jgi:O-antigen/teichoic acid export membrane protein
MTENTQVPLVDDYREPLAAVDDFASAGAAAGRLLRERKSPTRGFRMAIREMVSDSAQYLVGLALLSVASVVLVPLYTRKITPAEFGVYALVDVTVLALLTIAGLGLNVAYLKWFAEAQEAEVSALFSQMLLAGCIAAGILGAAFSLLLSSAWGNRWFGTSTREFAWILFPIVVTENLETLLLAHLRALRRSIAFCGASAVRLVAVVGASIWYLLVQHRGLTGIFWGRAVGDIVGVAVLIAMCASAFRISCSWHRIAGMVRFGLPLVFSALMATMLDASGRYFLSHYGSLAEVGMYSLGTKLSGLMRVVLVAPFGVAWGGVMFQIAREKNARTIYSKLLCYVFLVGVVAAVITDLFTPTLLAIFATPAYSGAGRIVSLLLLTQAAAMLQYPASVGIYLQGFTNVFAPIYGGAFLLDLALNRLLVPRFGIGGAAVSWLIAWSALVLSSAIVSQFLYPLHYEAKPFLLAGMACLAAFLFRRIGISGLTLAGMACITCFALAIATVVAGFIVADFRATSLRLEDER